MSTIWFKNYNKGQKLNSFYLKQLNPREEKTQINFYHLAKFACLSRLSIHPLTQIGVKEMFNLGKITFT